jgi:hypothetical protein
VHSRGFIYAPSNAYDNVVSAGVDLTGWSFYIDANQEAGPTRLARERSAFTMNGIAVEPIVLLLGQDATTSSWPNRGTLGGSLTAVNIQAEDVGLSTPYTDGTKSVRFNSAGGGTRRYYVASDSTFADITTEDFVWESVYTREGVEGGFSNIQFIKRNWASTTNNGYGAYSTASSTLTFTTKSSGAVGPEASSATTGQYCWQHVGGYFDNSQTASTGQAVVNGSQSSAAAAHTAGSLANTVPFRVGDSTYDGYYTNSSAVACRIAYIAIWRRSDWLAGAANLTDYTVECRARQTYMSGIVESVAGYVPTTYSTAQTRSTKTWDGSSWEHHLVGPGCMAPDQYELYNSEEKISCVRFESQATGQTSAENFTGWSNTNISTAVSTALLPTSNLRGISSTGVTHIGTAGTAAKYFQLLLSTSTNKWMTHVWVKPGAAGSAYLHLPDAGASGVDINRYIRFNFNTGATEVGSGTLAAWAVPYVNGWWLLYCSARNSTAVAMNLRIGFCNSESTFDLTSDGYAVDGYVWGWTGASSGTLTYPDQEFPYFGINSPSNSGPLLVWPGITSTASAPYSMWWEHMSEWRVAGFGATAYPMQVSTDGSNAAYFSTGGTPGATVMSSTGINANVTQWTQTSATQTGANTASSGDRVRFAASLATNDIKLYNTEGTSIAPDASAIVPINMTTLRWGNNAAGTIVGRGVQYTRIGIKSSASTDSNGPPGGPE